MAVIDTFTEFHALNEGLSAVVYHYTTTQSIVRIIEEDRMKAASAMANDSDGGKLNRNQHFYISFQRGKYSGTGYAGKTSIGACIAFDGEKLNKNFRSTAVEYFTKPRKKPGDLPKYDIKDYPHKDELEDRIVLDSPYLEKVRRYILEIHIWVTDGKVYQDHRQLGKIGAQLGIPVYFYGDKASYQLKRKDKAQALDSFEQATMPPLTHDEWQDRLNSEEMGAHALQWIAPLYVYKDPANKAKLDALFSPKYRGDDHNGLYYQVQNFEHRLRYGESMKHYIDEFYSSVRSIRQSHNEWVLKFAKLLSKDYRRYNALYADDYMKNKLAHIQRQAELDKLKPQPYTIVAIENGQDEWEDVTKDKVEYNYYDEGLQEDLTKFLQGRGTADIAAFIDRFYEATMGDLLDLLKKYVKPRGIEKWFGREGFKPFTEEEFKPYQTRRMRW